MNIQSLVNTIPGQDITRFHKSIKAYHPNPGADEHSPAGQAHKKGHVWAKATQGPGINRRWIFDDQGNYLGYVDGQQEACVFYDIGKAW